MMHKPEPVFLLRWNDAEMSQKALPNIVQIPKSAQGDYHGEMLANFFRGNKKLDLPEIRIRTLSAEQKSAPELRTPELWEIVWWRFYNVWRGANTIFGGPKKMFD